MSDPGPLIELRAGRGGGVAWRRRALWLLPLGVSAVFVGVIGGWAAANETRAREALERQLRDDAESVQAQLGARLDLERARLRDAALRLSSLAASGQAVDLASLPEVVAGFDRLWNRVIWLDPGLRVMALADRRRAPVGGGGIEGEGLRIRGRGQADHLEQPVRMGAGDAAGEGRLLARYDLTELLLSTDLAWLSRRYEVTFVSSLGEVVATTARPDRLPGGAPLERPLPAFLDTVLRLAPYQAPPAWYRSPGTLALMAGLVLLGFGASLLLRREVRQVSQAEAGARTEAAWRRSMEDSALVGLRARDVEGRILYVNRTLCEMVGYGAEELVGLRPPLPFWPPESVEALMDQNRNTLAGGAPAVGYETRWRHRDGRAVDVLIYESPLVDAEGRQIGWMGSIVDVSERKRLEDQERRHVEALAQHARLNDLGLLASELAHELNQPLTALAAYSSGLLALLQPGDVVDGEARAGVEAIQRNARRAGEIVNWIRRQGTRAEPVREPCDVDALVDDVLRARRRWLQRLQTGVSTELAGTLPPVLADRVGIEQVLTNLVRNAADAMAGQPGSPRVEVRTELLPAGAGGPAQVRVEVCDRGPGLQGRSLDELCATFFTTKRDGMGLGLGISRAIVEQHGGRLAAADRPGGGACFSFTLPVPEPAEPTPQR